LLREVADAGEDRRVAYVCAIAYLDADGREQVFFGRCEGELASEPRGSGGFGYDPAFIPDDTGPEDRRTMGELPAEATHAMSRRIPSTPTATSASRVSRRRSRGC